MNYINKIKDFFDNLSSKPIIGGLQITNSSVQIVFAHKKGGAPSAFSMKLPPGVVRDGKLEDRKKFVEIMNNFHNSLFPDEPKRNVKVVVSLPSDTAYTQIFDIPNVGDKNLKESANLNLQMISPIPEEKAYMSWQVVNETEDKYEILGAFIEKEVVDKFVSALVDSNFQAVSIEFPSLSLSWTVKNIIGEKKESFLVLNISSDGFDIFLLKNGSVYFDYFRSWRSIQGDSEQIDKKVFEESLIDEIRKVTNFTSSRFNENIKSSLLIAPGLEENVKNILENNFNIKATTLSSNHKGLGPAWYVALGAALRGSWDRSTDDFISLGTERAEIVFHREQVIDFIKLWRNIIASVAVSFLVLFGASIFLMNSQPKALSERLEVLNLTSQQQELNELISAVEEYNSLSSMISSARSRSSFINFLDDLRVVTQNHGITITSLNFNTFSNPISINARSSSNDNIIRFRDALRENEKYDQVDLPLSNIVSSEGGGVTFSVGFVFNDIN